MMKNREYLNDYKLAANGEYVYTGKYYTYTSDVTKKKRDLAFLTAVLTAAVIASGFINGSGMDNTFYVILPYIAEVACVFALCWNVVRLLGQRDRIKEYVYRVVVKNIPNALKTLMLCSALSFVATIVCLIIQIKNNTLDYWVAYPIIKVIEFLVSFLTLKVFNTISFEQE